jgi:hypothetical protein
MDNLINDCWISGIQGLVAFRDQGYIKAILTLYQGYINAMFKNKNIALI